MNQFSQYIRATMAEMKQVSWPTQFQTAVYTSLVIGISTLVALFVGAFDFVFGRAIDFILIGF